MDPRRDGGARLPYLLKILAARQSLSIQAHPTKRQAEEGWAAERELPEGAPHNYADDNHKPEMIVSLCDEFVALCGLRDIERTRELLAELGDAASPLLERIRDDASLADAIAWLLSGDAQETVDAISLALADARSDAFAADFDNARRNAADFPGDPGIVVGLLMNLMTLGYGEALFLRAGQLHAYQSGIGVEIMAASDNVMRGGLTPKHIDVAELMRVLERTSGPVALVRPVSAGADSTSIPSRSTTSGCCTRGSAAPDPPRRTSTAPRSCSACRAQCAFRRARGVSISCRAARRSSRTSRRWKSPGQARFSSLFREYDASSRHAGGPLTFNPGMRPLR